MKLKEFLEEEIIKLPKSYSDDYLPEVFNNHMKEYLEVVKKLEKSVLIYEIDINKIEELSEFIFNALEHYHKGNPAIAYNEIKKFFNCLKSQYEKVYWIQKIKNESFYRVRTDKLETDSRLEMFHLPFSKRYKANPQRYSVLGLPYLYLGESLQVCWEEMGKPDTKDMKIALFELKEELSLLYLNSNIKKHSIDLKLHVFLLLYEIYMVSKEHKDIENLLKEKKLFEPLKIFDSSKKSGDLMTIIDNYHKNSETLDKILIDSENTIEDLYEYINPNLIGQIKKYRENGNIDESIKYIDERIKYIETATFLIEKNILLFPLHLACSYIVKEGNRVFKPEYIVPQLVSQYISEHNQINENKIDGISYMSTKIHEYSTVSEDYKLYTNLALLTYPRQGIEYCEEVSKKFRMTDILSIQDFENLKVGIENDIGDEIESIKDIAKVYENRDISKFYKKSNFSKVEDYLKKQKKYDINIK